MEKEVTVKKLLEKYNELGIPHFQRGLVWNDDSVSMLLESLYYDTPIGSIVLWKPDNLSQGVPLSDQPFKYLIIDGQQRLRSLHSVFINDDDASEEEAQEEDPRVWCLNLRKITSLNKYYAETNREFSLFIKIRDPLFDPSGQQEVKKKTYFDNNFIPLKLLRFIDSNEDRIKKLIQPLDPRNIGEMFNKLRDEIRASIDQMLARPVFVVMLEKNKSFAEVIELYNRINSGGKRVDAEEIAYATLVSLFPDTPKQIERIFNKFHGPEITKELHRDSIFQRIKEQHFGFKLFIRTFVQVCSYHFDLSLGSSGFSFAILESDTFLRTVEKLDPEAKVLFFNKMWEITENILVHTRTLLERILKCDDLRFLPETNSLLPIFQILIKFYPDPPGPDDWFDQDVEKNITAIYFQLALVYRSNQKIMKFIDSVNKANTLESALDKLKEDTKILEEKFIDNLKNPMSLNDRSILLLYWLLRHRGAKDFSYKLNHVYKPDKFQKPEANLCTKEEPQKQHIIPYSKLKNIFKITERTRLSTDKVNNIGNITYISSLLNCFDGVAEKALELDQEDPENLIKHFLLEEDKDKNKGKYKLVLSTYDALTKPDKNNNKDPENAYETFINARQLLIANAFLDWINELSDFPCKPCGIQPANRLGKTLVSSENKFQSSLRQKWDEDMFFGEIKKQYSPTEQNVFKMLYEFSDQNASHINWGTGVTRGSFSPVFKQISPSSLYTLRSNGQLSINFGGLGLTKEMEHYRDRFKEELEKSTGLRMPPDIKRTYPVFSLNEWALEIDGLIRAIKSAMEISQ